MALNNTSGKRNSPFRFLQRYEKRSIMKKLQDEEGRYAKQGA